MPRHVSSSIAAPGFSLATAVELLKPITWFALMWAFGCGVVSAGVSPSGRWLEIVVGILLAGPLVCGTSQPVEPGRLIPSGRMPGNWGLIIAVTWTVLSSIVAFALGWWVFFAAVVGLALAYSAPPLRLKQNGWYGNLAVAAIYSAGAHGIMTLNDFKSIDGDRQMGVRSITAQLGADYAARLACAVMAAPQVLVIALLWGWSMPVYAAGIAVLLVVQFVLMCRFLSDPRAIAPWYNATGTLLYVLGVLTAAFALAHLIGGGA